MEICETPFRDVDVVDSRPSTLFSAASSGRLSCLSTTSGDAPGIAVITEICGNSIEGMSSCLRDDMVITPNTAAKTVISAISALFASESFARRNIALSPGIYGLSLVVNRPQPGRLLVLDGVGRLELERTGSARFQLGRKVGIVV